MHRPQASDKRFCLGCGCVLDLLPPWSCTDCGTRFDPLIPSTFGTSRSMLAPFLQRMPAALRALGVHAIVTEETFLPAGGDRSYMPVDITVLRGTAAIAMGWARVGAGFALHCHYFWGRIEPFWRFSMVGVIAGCAAVTAGWGIAFVMAVHRAFELEHLAALPRGATIVAGAITFLKSGRSGGYKNSSNFRT